MTLLSETTQGPFTEIIATVITAVIFGIWRAIEKGSMERKQKRELKRARLQTPPVDAQEQLQKMAEEDKATVDTISNFVKPIVESLSKRKK